MRFPSLYKSSLLRQKRGVLLYGPPGTGGWVGGWVGGVGGGKAACAVPASFWPAGQGTNRGGCSRKQQAACGVPACLPTCLPCAVDVPCSWTVTASA